MNNASGYSCSLSPRLLLQSIELDTIAFMPVESSKWGREISLVVRPDDPTDDPFLSRLRGEGGKVIAAYQYSVAICEVSDLIHVTRQGASSSWEIQLREERTDFSRTMEIGLGGTSTDELAEKRARRLLLNENPSKETTDINAVVQELFTRGFETAIQIERSPFPTIFRYHQSEPARFVQIAWILAAMQLKLSAIVAQIDRLVLTLAGNRLSVDFEGRRPRRYQNTDSHTIRVRGNVLYSQPIKPTEPCKQIAL